MGCLWSKYFNFKGNNLSFWYSFTQNVSTLLCGNIWVSFRKTCQTFGQRTNAWVKLSLATCDKWNPMSQTSWIQTRYNISFSLPSGITAFSPYCTSSSFKTKVFNLLHFPLNCVLGVCSGLRKCKLFFVCIASLGV